MEMHWLLLLTDLIPVLIFVVLDSRGQVKHAVIAAVGAAALEIAFSYLFLGGVDEFSLAYVALFLLFGGLSYRFNNALFFKFKPVAISGVTAAIFLGGELAGKPILLLISDRYGDLLGGEAVARLSAAPVRTVLERVSLYMVFGLALHAALVAWVALRLNTWWWFAARTGGGFLIVALILLIAR